MMMFGLNEIRPRVAGKRLVPELTGPLGGPTKSMPDRSGTGPVTQGVIEYGAGKE